MFAHRCLVWPKQQWRDGQDYKRGYKWILCATVSPVSKVTLKKGLASTAAKGQSTLGADHHQAAELNPWEGRHPVGTLFSCT